MYRYIKALAALIGGVAPITVVGALSVLGLHVDADVIVRIVAVASPVLAGLLTLLSPKNADAKAADDKAAAEIAETAEKVIGAVAAPVAVKAVKAVSAVPTEPATPAVMDAQAAYLASLNAAKTK